MRQQAGGVHLHSGDLLLVTLRHGHMFPKLLNCGVRASRLQKNRDPNNPPVAGLVHKMCHHIVRLAVNVLLAGTVKVELRQLVALVADNHKVSASRGVVVVHSNGVAVVN